MFFSANKRGIPRNNIQIQPQQPLEPIQNINENKDIFNANAYLLKYGMLARIQNAPGCSSCGK